MDDARLNTLGETIVAALPGAALGHDVSFNQLTVSVDLAKIVDIVRVLKTDPRFRFVNITDVTAVDYPGRENRFEVVYQMVSLKGVRRLRVRVPVPEEDAAVESLTPLWKGANFLEREVWDLFGIRFIDHPDLRRILLYEEFQGHPLRKDYPVNLWQPRVPERAVEGTFVDERSRNKLLMLKQALGQKN